MAQHVKRVMLLSVFFFIGTTLFLEGVSFPQVKPPPPGPDYVWVDRVKLPSGIYVGGFWRPVKKPDFVWVGGYRDSQGLWVAGFWKPVKVRRGYVWIPGHWKRR